MPTQTPVFFETPAAFRAWLKANHHTEKELQVGYYKKATGLPSLTWEESVGEALCFGWIDGIRHRIDDIAYTIRFTPRKPKSVWSSKNIHTVEQLLEFGLMEPAGIAAYEKRTRDRSNQYSYEQKDYTLPDIYLDVLKANPIAFANYEALPPSTKRITNAYILQAKQEKTRQKRMGIVFDSCLEGKKIPQLRPKKNK